LQQIPKPQKSKDELLRTQRKKVLLNSRNGLRECGSQRPNAPLFPPIPKGSQPLAGGKRSATSGQLSKYSENNFARRGAFCVLDGIRIGHILGFMAKASR
jgi:hypothetical protein